MKNWLIALTLIMLAAAAYYYVAVSRPQVEEASPPPIPPVAIEKPEPEPVPAPVVVEPVEEEIVEVAPEPEIVDEATILPVLDESDEVVVGSLSGLVGEDSVMRFVVSDNVISRVVASVDALTARQVPGRIMAAQELSGEFLATANEQPVEVIRNDEGDPIPQYLLNPANYQRYSQQVELFEAIDTEELMALYREYTPLFQQAYTELGYPEGDFNKRLIEVIDSLLASPEIHEPLRLIKPEAYYLLANQDLEALPAGQKILLRMGPDNAQRIKVKLQEIRVALVSPD